MLILLWLIANIAVIVFIFMTIFEKDPIKKKKKRKYWLISLGVAFLLLIIAIARAGGSDDKKANKNEDEIKEENPAEDLNEEETPEIDSKEALKKALEEKESLVWFGDVRNDVTGNWRYSMYSESDTQETFAADYYKAFFENDEEIHAVINTTLKTTARFTVSSLDKKIMFVTILEYVDGEEHDAKLLFSGMPLKSYTVHLDTGEIEDASSEEEGDSDKPEYQTIFEDVMKRYDYSDLNIFETTDNGIKLDFMSNQVVSNETAFVRMNIQNYLNYSKTLYDAHSEYSDVYYTAFVTMPDTSKVNALNMKMSQEVFKSIDWYSLGNEQFYKKFVESCEVYDLSPVFSKYIDETEIFP